MKRGCPILASFARVGGDAADATLLGQIPLPMRLWSPPFAKCAKDVAPLVVCGDRRSKAGPPWRYVQGKSAVPTGLARFS